MTYTCRLELRYGHVAKYALYVYYKIHWYNLEKNKCLQLFHNDEELDNFLEGLNMKNIIEMIKSDLQYDEIKNKNKEDIEIKISNFNKKYKNIKIEI